MRPEIVTVNFSTPSGVLPIRLADNGDLLINEVRVSAADLLRVFDPTKPDLDRLFCKRGDRVYVTRGSTDLTVPPRKG